MELSISTLAEEGIYQGSKWLKFQVLCDREELKKLFDRLCPFWIYSLTGLKEQNEVCVSQDTFLDVYGTWIEKLSQGVVPTDTQLRSLLAVAFTKDPQALWLQEVPGQKYLVKLRQPVVQVQAHAFSYSPIDQVFRPLSMGSNSIFWGIQLSYPQIYQDPKTMELVENKETINQELFATIRQWVRDETRPTPFEVDGKRTNAPIRLGKNCFSWIHAHPQLKEQKISVFASPQESYAK